MNDQNATATPTRRIVPRVAEGNSRFNRIYSGLLASLGAAFLLVSAPVLAATAPPLGIAGQFGALGGAGVTGATGTGVSVNGDVGSSPTATITNFPPSSTVSPYIVHNAIDGVVNQAQVDALNASLALAAQGGARCWPIIWR
jgi:hypothetical protein